MWFSPPLLGWSRLIAMLTSLLSFSGTWQAFPNTSHAAGSQPAYLSEKNRPESPCPTLTSRDDNPLARNISSNCLENRCLTTSACNWLSLLPLIPTWPSVVTKMLPLPVTHSSILSHCWKTGSGGIQSMGVCCCAASWATNTQSFLLTDGESLQGGNVERLASFTLLLLLGST